MASMASAFYLCQFLALLLLLPAGGVSLTRFRLLLLFHGLAEALYYQNKIFTGNLAHQ